MKKSVRLAAIAAIISLMLCGCGSSEDWAYIHEPEKTILSLSDNGKAVYKDEKYTYTKDDTYLTLTGKDGSELKMRFVPDGDKMILYERSTYTADGDHDGIVGVWKQDNGWSYQFTDQNTFAEENIFHGHYSVDEDAGTIKLMYDDPIEDAILYYSFDGDDLVIDYPWPVVKTTKK